MSDRPMTSQEYRDRFQPVVMNPDTGATFRIRKIRPAELLLDGIISMPQVEHAKTLSGKKVDDYDAHDAAVTQLIATAILVRGVTSMRLVDKAREDCAEDEMSARSGEGLDESDREFLVTQITRLSGFADTTETVLAPGGAPDDSFRDAACSPDNEGEPGTGS